MKRHDNIPEYRDTLIALKSDERTYIPGLKFITNW